MIDEVTERPHLSRITR